MSVWLVNIAVTLLTAVVLYSLYWGYWRNRQEKQRRKLGEFTIPIDAGHIVASGCLGVLGYLGLLFILVSLTLSRFEESSAPEWLAWVIAIGLLVGFFAMTGWVVFGIGSSFAVNRLVVNDQGIRVMRWRRIKTTIYWEQPWQLERMAHQRRVRYRAFVYGTEYNLLLRLVQDGKELVLIFDAAGESVGGLPPVEGRLEGLRIVEDAEWLQARLLRQFERWDEEAGEKPADLDITASEKTVEAPSAALMRALHFSEEELSLNRQLKASRSQVSPIRRDKLLTLATYVVMAIAFGAAIVYSFKQLLDGQSFETYGALLVVCLLVTGFCLFMAAITWVEAKSDTQIERVSGQIKLEHYPQSGEYWLRVGEEAFQVWYSLFEILENGAFYNFYVARSGIGSDESKLLSAEKRKQL